MAPAIGRRTTWGRRAAATLAAAVLLLAACAPAATPTPQATLSPLGGTTAGDPQPAPASLVKTDGGEGGVTLEATWLTPGHFARLSGDALQGRTPEREVLVLVTLDTHSVDLSRYDLPSLATLRGRGDAPVAATAWVGISESSHHREGLLVFPGEGNAAWMAREGRAELRVEGIAGVAERVLTWES